MKTNFDRIKDRLYNYIMSQPQQIGVLTLVNNVAVKKFQPFYKTEEEFKSDLNSWLDSLDIRSIERMKNQLKGTNVLPTFMYNGRYCIDYNKNNRLDIIRIRE